MTTNLYATDGLCHNSNPGTFNHECGKPARWLGTNRRGFKSGLCDCCKQGGYEARDCDWQPIAPLPNGWDWECVETLRAKWDISPNMVPVATGPGCVAWGTINSVRTEQKPAASPVDVSNIQEYGLTQKLSNSIRVF